MTALEFTAGIANSYVLKADDGYLLLDTGESGQFEEFREALHSTGIAQDDIEYLLLTHHHGDHVGFVNEIREDVTIIAHESAQEPLNAGENARSGGGLLNRRIYYAGKILSTIQPDMDLSFPPVELRDDDILISGRNEQLLREIGIEGTILHTPGHSRDSISVLLDDGRLFCGDVACNFPRLLGIGSHPLIVTDCETLYDSWQKILDTHAETLYPGHGGPFEPSRLNDEIGRFDNEDLIDADPVSDRYDSFDPT